VSIGHLLLCYLPTGAGLANDVHQEVATTPKDRPSGLSGWASGPNLASKPLMRLLVTSAR
jgi:hypothetical protein